MIRGSAGFLYNLHAVGYRHRRKSAEGAAGAHTMKAIITAGGVASAVAVVAILFLPAKPEPVAVEPPYPVFVEPVVLASEPAPMPLEPAVPAATSPAAETRAEIPIVVEPRVAQEPVPVQVPVQPLEERGDAMLFEIDALNNLPFDQAVTMPFD